MTLRPQQKRGPAKKLTREVLRQNPLIAALARLRAKQLREARREDSVKGQQDLFAPKEPSE